MEIVYADNHIIVVNKAPGEIVQGDKTGDEPLSETVKAWIKEKYNKSYNPFYNCPGYKPPSEKYEPQTSVFSVFR